MRDAVLTALTAAQARIFQAVAQRPGILASQLREIVWAHDIDGGPEDFKALHVHIHGANKRLKQFNLAIRGVRGDHVGGYYLETLEQ